MDLLIAFTRQKRRACEGTPMVDIVELKTNQVATLRIKLFKGLRITKGPGSGMPNNYEER